MTTNATPDQPDSKHAHSLPINRVVAEFRSNINNGLSAADAQQRIESHGANELREVPPPTFLHMLLQQFRDFVIIILIVAAGISILVGETVDAIAIIAIVLINAIIGVVQESKAENALRALKQMAAPTARVVRDGLPQSIPAREIVPGDLVILEAGNYVPADMRLIEAVNLKIDESSLTGESNPSDKFAEMVLDKSVPVGDRKNTAFMSTVVTYGRGKGMVTSTGMDTEIGLIARMIQSYKEEETPLQKRLDELGKTLSTVALILCGLVFLIGIIRNASGTGYQTSVLTLFMTAVSLAIAAVPEGLPAVVTITLALGMQRMVRRHVLLRKLRAVETLGSTTVICSDKTGTLTQNRMSVTQIYSDKQMVTVTGKGYDPTGVFSSNGQDIDASGDKSLTLLLLSAALCNDAQLRQIESGEWRMIGDPTEGALIVAAGKAGLPSDAMNDVYPRVSEIPFDSVRKYMTTIHDVQGSTKQAAGSREQGAVTSVAALPNPESRYPIPVFSSAYAAFLKGAPDIILDLCTHIQEDNDVRPLNADDRQRILAANESMADHALRVLGMAYKPLNSIPEDLTTVESGLTFLGLTGMIDAARPEVKDAVRLCRKAGIKAVMITGDYKNTATAVAKELDFFTPGRETVTGAELDQLSDEAFSKIVNEVDVYARVSPEHKVRIVEALKSQNHIVAMTGDGVNDAPALKRASIGVAMGITGTDVAKATADMVITDDNFASIVSGVEEGRIIYGNIRKFVYYLLACNVAEILIIFVSQLVGLPLPLRPIQLLWLNLLTDGLPALALAIEKGDPDVMQRRPRPSTEPIINREMWAGIGVQTVVATFAVLTAFVYGLSYFAGLPGEGTLTSAQTMAFVVLNSAELLVVYAFRSERFSLFRIGLLTNRPLIGATLLSFVLLLAVVYVPFFDPIFYTADLSLREWLIMIPLIILPFIAAELTKLVWRRREARRDNAS